MDPPNGSCSDYGHRQWHDLRGLTALPRVRLQRPRNGDRRRQYLARLGFDSGGGRLWDHGTNWSEVDSAVTRYQLSAISCATTSFCAAVGGSAGAGPPPVLTTTNGGANWTSRSVNIDETFIAVSCPSSADCVAVGLGGRIITTHDGGTTWSVTDTGHLYLVAVSCPSVKICFAASQNGLIIKSRDGAATWHTSASLAPSFRGMSCPSTLICYVASPTLGPSQPALITKTVDGGKKWQSVAIGGVNLASLSCSSTSHCVGVGTCRSILYCSGAQAVVTMDGGQNWSETDVTGNGPNFVSCSSALNCVAVGSYGQGTIPGDITISADGGLTWTDQPVIDGSDLLGVSCNGTVCWAVGDGGAILAN